jgi:glutathione S-transferase
VSDEPRLFQIKISHYSEKARWALAHKRVTYESSYPPPGAHMLIAMWLTRGEMKTLPVLQLDGERIGDSSRIIAELERRYPDPPLYPDDPGDRERALAIEDYFDEQVGSHARLLAFHEAIQDPSAFGPLAAELAPRPLNRFSVAAAPIASGFVRLRYGVASKEAAETARRQIVAGFDRVESELGSGEYLVGGRFGVADLTAASLLFPIVLPPEAPQLPPPPAALAQFRDSLSGRPGFQWVEEMFRRHRRVALGGDEQGAARRAAGDPERR